MFAASDVDRGFIGIKSPTSKIVFISASADAYAVGISAFAAEVSGTSLISLFKTHGWFSATDMGVTKNVLLKNIYGIL